MNTNDTAVKGIILLGVVSIILGAVLAAMGKADPVVTIFVVIGSNALSALAGYMTAIHKKAEADKPDPNQTAGDDPALTKGDAQ